jgi:ATP-dependent protease ClpP protease subunit
MPVTTKTLQKKQSFDAKRQQKYVKTNASNVGKVQASKYYDKCRMVFDAFSDEDFYGPKATHIFFYGGVDKDNVQELRMKLQQAQGNAGVARVDENKTNVEGSMVNSKLSGNVKIKQKPIVLHLHSPGGVADFGITMMNFLNEIDAPMAVVVDGYACSAVTPILVAAPYRVMHDFSFVLIHEGSVSIDESKNQDATFDVNQYLTHLDAEYNNVYRANTRIPNAELTDLVSRDKFLDAGTCKKWSVIDRVLSLDPKAARKRWDAALQANPELRPSVQNLRGNTFNHMFIYDGKDFNDKNVLNDKVSEILKVVRSMQQLMVQPDSVTVKPIVLHNNFNMTPNWRIFDLATLMVRVNLLRTPIYGVIDSNIDIMTALPCIMSHRRYMYNNTKMTIRLTFEHRQFSKDYSYYHDIKHNTELIRLAVRKILSQHTRMPKELLDRLFEERIMLSAEDCLRYGLIDEIIPSPSRPRRKNAGLEVGVQGGGCSCSQGLAYDFSM